MTFRLLIFILILFNLLIIINGEADNKFLFSVILSIYNTARYLNESIGSILNQTISFEKNIQLILVNDGSIDNSEEVCLKYLNKYPNNIIYVYKDNGGLSSARNLGLKYVKGKYINFLDPDDIWSNDTFNLVQLFFNLHPNIDIVAGRMKFFDLMTNYHPLDYKFYKSRVIDLRIEYNCTHLSVASSFFRTKSVKGLKFIEGLIAGEDTLFVNNLLLKKPYMGVIRNAVYFYRKRYDETSITQTTIKNDIFYFKTPYYVHQNLLNKSLYLYNETLSFIQYYVAYDILFRLISKPYLYINLPKFIKYSQIIIEILKRIDDKYIIEQKHGNYKIKFFALSKKNNKDMRNYIIFKEGKLKYNDIIVFDPIKNRDIFIFIFIEIKDNKLIIEGKDNFWISRERYYFYCKIGNEIIFPEYNNFKPYNYKIMFGNIINGRIVEYNIPIEDKFLNENINFYLSYENNSLEIFPTFGYFAHIPPINNSYYINENYIIIYKNFKLKLIKNERIVREDLEKIYCKELDKMNKTKLIQIRASAVKFREKKHKKKIWLINDRADKGRDNGEYFFRYVLNKNPSDIKYYFVIKNNCSDFIRLRDLGHILIYGSKKYNITFLNADKIISSTSNKWVNNPFGLDRAYLIDLYHFDFIFLQHGITKDDVSKYIHRFATNFSIIITASLYEYRSFLSKDYYYSKENIKLTGFSRFDNLHLEKLNNKSDKTIIIIPTWRTYIKGTSTPVTYESVYSDTFKYTEYFKFYNNLINSPKLLETMEKLNYKGIFCLHPSYFEQSRDFMNNSLFTVIKFFDYQKTLIKSSLLITDYSSVFFDFSYMKKPIIYTQFDYEQYRKVHYQKGYFDYLLNGFGPVCVELEDCIDMIIDKLKKGCKIEKKYLKRINHFFRFFDNHNNDRIYKTIRNSSFDGVATKIKENKGQFILLIIINFLFFTNKIKYLLKSCNFY